MKNIIDYKIFIILLLLAFNSTVSAREMNIYTTNYPLYFFTKYIAEDYANVHLPVPEGVDPAHWTPDEDTLEKYQQADLIIVNGANYSRWLNLISLPENRLINTTRHLKDRYLYSGDVKTHNHGPKGEHSHANLAFTTWLDLDIAGEQAGKIAAGLIKTLPQHAQDLERNYQALLLQLKNFDKTLLALSKLAQDKIILCSHPVYQYLAHRYKLDLSCFHWEPQEMPSLSEWKKLEIMLEKSPTKWMIWEEPPRQEIIDMMHNYGLEPILYYPLAKKPKQGDFISVMTENIKRLEKSLDNSQ